MSQAQSELPAAGPEVPEGGHDRVRDDQEPGGQAARAAGRAGGEGQDSASTSPTRRSTKRLTQIKKQYFGGSEKKYQQQLKKQGLTDEQVSATSSSAADLGEDLREGHRRREGQRRATSTSTTSQHPQRSTPSRSRATSATSSSKNKALADTDLQPAQEGGADFADAREEVLDRIRRRRTPAASSPVEGPDGARSSTRSPSRSRRTSSSKPVKTRVRLARHPGDCRR